MKRFVSEIAVLLLFLSSAVMSMTTTTTERATDGSSETERAPSGQMSVQSVCDFCKSKVKIISKEQNPMQAIEEFLADTKNHPQHLDSSIFIEHLRESVSHLKTMDDEAQRPILDFYLKSSPDQLDGICTMLGASDGTCNLCPLAIPDEVHEFIAKVTSSVASGKEGDDARFLFRFRGMKDMLSVKAKALEALRTKVRFVCRSSSEPTPKEWTGLSDDSFDCKKLNEEGFKTRWCAFKCTDQTCAKLSVDDGTIYNKGGIIYFEHLHKKYKGGKMFTLAPDTFKTRAVVLGKIGKNGGDLDPLNDKAYIDAQAAIGTALATDDPVIDTVYSMRDRSQGDKLREQNAVEVNPESPPHPVWARDWGPLFKISNDKSKCSIASLETEGLDTREKQRALGEKFGCRGTDPLEGDPERMRFIEGGNIFGLRGLCVATTSAIKSTYNDIENFDMLLTGTNPLKERLQMYSVMKELGCYALALVPLLSSGIIDPEFPSINEGTKHADLFIAQVIDGRKQIDQAGHTAFVVGQFDTKANSIAKHPAVKKAKNGMAGVIRKVDHDTKALLDGMNKGLDQAERILEKAKAIANSEGASFKFGVVRKPMGAVIDGGEMENFFASFTNLLTVYGDESKKVLLPDYGDTGEAYSADARAEWVTYLQACGYTVKDIGSLALLPKGGAIHCLTKTVPFLGN